MNKPAQAPAEGIYIARQFENATFFTVPCQCGNEGDEIEFTIELEDGVITLHQSSRQTTDHWTHHFKKRYESGIINTVYDAAIGFANDVYNRIRVTWQVWRHGYATYHQYTMLSEQQAVNYAQALLDTVARLREQSK